MTNLDIFGDGRKTPRLSVSLKVKVKTRTQEESTTWNTVFGYLMKKTRTKLEFLSVNSLRKLQLDKLKLEMIKDLLKPEDYLQLHKIEYLFDNNLTIDLKAFILAILKISSLTISEKLNSEIQ